MRLIGTLFYILYCSGNLSGNCRSSLRSGIMAPKSSYRVPADIDPLFLRGTEELPDTSEFNEPIKRRRIDIIILGVRILDTKKHGTSTKFFSLPDEIIIAETIEDGTRNY